MLQLPDRLTTSQIAAIPATVATGTLVYNTTTNLLNYYNGSAWVALDTTSGSGSSLVFGTGSLALAGNLTTLGAFTTSLTATANTAVTLPTSGTLLNGTSVGVSASAVASGTLTATSNATLAIVPGLTVPVVSGATYIFEIYLQGVSGATGGLKVSLYGSSTTATFTAGYADSWLYNGTTIAGQTQTQAASGNQISTAAIYSTATITGSITVNAGGNFAVMAAQVASNGTSTTVLPGSYLMVTRVS